MILVRGTTTFFTKPQSASALLSGTRTSWTRPVYCQLLRELGLAPGLLCLTEAAAPRSLMMNAAPLAARTCTHPGFVVLNVFSLLPADPILIRTHHADAEFVKYLKGRLIARKPDFPPGAFMIGSASSLIWQEALEFRQRAREGQIIPLKQVNTCARRVPCAPARRASWPGGGWART